MTSRYVPNEATCPVPVDVLGALLRSENDAVANIVNAIPTIQRAALAAFCFSRSHMRNLSFRIAALCEAETLRAVAGVAAETLIEQSAGLSAFDEGPRVFSPQACAARSACIIGS